MDKPEELVIDLDWITGNEIIEFEELADMAFDQFGEPGQRKGRALVALATIVKRRDVPGYTFEEAGELRIILNNVPDPTGPGA